MQAEPLLPASALQACPNSSPASTMSPPAAAPPSNHPGRHLCAAHRRAGGVAHADFIAPQHPAHLHAHRHLGGGHRRQPHSGVQHGVFFSRQAGSVGQSGGRRPT